MFRFILFLIIIVVSTSSYGAQTKVKTIVLDKPNGEPIFELEEGSFVRDVCIESDFLHVEFEAVLSDEDSGKLPNGKPKAFGTNNKPLGIVLFHEMLPFDYVKNNRLNLKINGYVPVNSIAKESLLGNQVNGIIISNKNISLDEFKIIFKDWLIDECITQYKVDPKLNCPELSLFAIYSKGYLNWHIQYLFGFVNDKLVVIGSEKQMTNARNTNGNYFSFIHSDINEKYSKCISSWLKYRP